MGQYTSMDAEEIYRGEFYAGKRQGCGMLLNIAPYVDLLEDGVEPDKAWKAAKPQIYTKAKFGTWRRDYLVAEPDKKGQRYCHINEIK